MRYCVLSRYEINFPYESHLTVFCIVCGSRNEGIFSPHTERREIFDHEFKNLLRQLNGYLEALNQLAENHPRMREVSIAFSKANILFPDATIKIQNCPPQLGTIIMTIKTAGIVFSRTEEINMLIRIINKADSIKIYAETGNIVCMAAVFQEVYTSLY